MRTARVWVEPDQTIASAHLADNPDDKFKRGQVVHCRFAPEPTSGNTAKFDCALKDDDVVKVKYGPDNPEVFAEVIASRLLSALGFLTDRMYVVAAVECAGCPAQPFEALQCLGRTGATVASCFGAIDYSKPRTFADAVIEKRLSGRRIESGKQQGWGWNELAKIDPSAGGASRAQVDAFRLMAVFLSHWDNKPENQRLMCIGETDEQTPCKQPLAMVQDLGATFGPNKLDVTRWRATPVWSDAAACGVSMRSLPYGGSSFPDTQISEQGRVFLAERLGRLTATQVRDLFEGARIERYTAGNAPSRDVAQWVEAFVQKVAAIVRHPPCPQ